MKFNLFNKNGARAQEVLENRISYLKENLEQAYLRLDDLQTDVILERGNSRSDRVRTEEAHKNQIREIESRNVENIYSIENTIQDLKNQIKNLESQHAVELSVEKNKFDSEVEKVRISIKKETNKEYDNKIETLEEKVTSLQFDASNYHGLYEGALLCIQTLEEQLAGQNDLISSLIGKTPDIKVNVTTPTTIAGQVIEKSK